MFFETEPKAPKQRAIDRADLKLLDYKPKARQMAQTAWPVGDEVVFDCEVYPNFFLAAFKHLKSQTYLICPVANLAYMLWTYKLISFNGRNYDIPIIEAAIKGASEQELYVMSARIITDDDYRPLSRDRNYNHIDIIEVAPLRESLKTYAGRLHCERMQDLPFDPHSPLDDKQKAIVTDYCFNDLDNTELVYNELRPYIALREHLRSMYNTGDLRSESDQKLAKLIMNAEIERLTGSAPRKPKSQIGRTFRFEAPAWVKFYDHGLQAMLADIQSGLITVGTNGHVEAPTQLNKRKVLIAGKPYTIGLGGLHSNEKKTARKANDNETVTDCDVTGYYSNLILSNDIYPAHIGPVFNQALRGLVDKREEAKVAKNDAVASCLKIATLAIFGMTSEQHSTVYDPKATVQITLSGQMALLMEIEWLEREGFSVVSANTDGIVVIIPTDRRARFDEIVSLWQKTTGLNLEYTEYSWLLSRDVSNYISLKANGEWKQKGAYSERGSALNSVLSRHPDSFIVVDAVKGFLESGASISDTIRNCRDMRRFVSLGSTKSGAHWRGTYLGKTIRWYYAKGITGSISKLNGDQMPKTQGAKPLMEMNGLEPDIDYDWYVNAAEQMLFDIGYYKQEKEVMLL